MKQNKNFVGKTKKSIKVYVGTQKYSGPTKVKDVIQSTYGIGKTFHRRCFKKLSIPYHASLKKIGLIKTNAISEVFSKRSLGDEFRKYKITILKDLQNSRIYRGLRMRMGLPRNGQRTHSNAKSQRKLRGSLF